jgi:hypothetical protein
VKQQWAPHPDRLIVAELAGEARRRAPYREPTEDETAEAAAALAEIAGDRADLLAEEAGILIGFYGADPLPQIRAKARAAARFLIAAGADEAAVLRWVHEGQERRCRADQPPFGIKVTPPPETRSAAPPA